VYVCVCIDLNSLITKLILLDEVESPLIHD
jgi:hypothetical protein